MKREIEKANQLKVDMIKRAQEAIMNGQKLQTPVFEPKEQLKALD
jgi:hypothetical protein